MPLKKDKTQKKLIILFGVKFIKMVKDVKVPKCNHNIKKAV
jgi:hypothetical protein